MRYLSIVMLVCLAFGSAQARERLQLYPVDEGLQEESLVEFRLELLEIIRDRDAERLEAMCIEQVKLSFGGISFSEAFGDPKAERWERLNWAVAHGGYFEDDTHTLFNAPYVIRLFEGVSDAERKLWPWAESAFVKARNVNFRDKPDTTGKVIDLLSFEAVEITNTTRYWEQISAGSGYVAVKDWQGRDGFIDASFLRARSDYRLYIGRQPEDGHWKIETFVAGD